MTTYQCLEPDTAAEDVYPVRSILITPSFADAIVNQFIQELVQRIPCTLTGPLALFSGYLGRVNGNGYSSGHSWQPLLKGSVERGLWRLSQSASSGGTKLGLPGFRDCSCFMLSSRTWCTRHSGVSISKVIHEIERWSQQYRLSYHGRCLKAKGVCVQKIKRRLKWSDLERKRRGRADVSIPWIIRFQLYSRDSYRGDPKRTTHLVNTLELGTRSCLANDLQKEY